MSFFRKLLGIGQNKVNEAVEKAVENTMDIKREGNAIISSIEKKISTIKKRIGEAQVEVCKSKNEVDSLINKNDILQERVAFFVKDGDDEKALQALSIIESNEVMIESLQHTVDILQPVIDTQIQYIQKLNSEKNSLRAEITRLDLEEKAYKLRVSMLGVSGDTVNGFNIQDLRDKMLKAKAEVEAKEIIGDKLGDKVVLDDIKIHRQSLQDRLDIIKKGEVK